MKLFDTNIQVYHFLEIRLTRNFEGRKMRFRMSLKKSSVFMFLSSAILVKVFL